MVIRDEEITIRLSEVPYHRLQALARKTGKSQELLVRELMEQALQDVSWSEAATSAWSEAATSASAHEILRSAGRLRSLSPALRQRIIPGVTLEEVRAVLDEAGGPPLSEIIRLK